MLARTDPEHAEDLFELAQQDIDDQWHYYEQMAGVEREVADEFEEGKHERRSEHQLSGFEAEETRLGVAACAPLTGESGRIAQAGRCRGIAWLSCRRCSRNRSSTKKWNSTGCSSISPNRLPKRSLIFRRWKNTTPDHAII